MSKGTILVIEPEFDIRNMLKIYFSGMGYDVIDVENVPDDLDTVKCMKAKLILLDVDTNKKAGLEFVKRVRNTIEIKHLPLVMLSRDATKEDNLPYLEFGADDFGAKPIDLEELKARISNAINLTYRPPQKNFLSQLPLGWELGQHMVGLLCENKFNWCCIDLEIRYFDAYKDIYGWQSGDEVIRHTATLIREMFEKDGTDDDLIGHVANVQFVIISHLSDVEARVKTMVEQFNQDLAKFHSKHDVERGYLLRDDKQVPLMSLAYGICDVSQLEHEKLDAPHITQVALADRQKRYPEYYSRDDEPPILTAW
jgi:CheY-like chemotaxis protein